MTGPRPSWGIVAASMLCGCQSGLSEVTPFTPVVNTFEGRYIDTIATHIEPAAGAEDGGAETKALNDLRISQGLATMEIAGLVSAPQMQRYLEQVLEKILADYPYDRPQIKIFIDAADRGTAQATADGEIYVALGLLDRLENEGQLAMVLGHEAAHILLDHFARSDYIEAQRKAVTVGGGIAMLGAAAGNAKTQKIGERTRIVDGDRLDTQEKVAQLETASWMINTLSDHVLNNLWSRKQEEMADLLAADLLVSAGYNPRASADLFRLLVELRAEEGSYLDFLKKQQEIAVRDLGDSDSASEFARDALTKISTTIGSGAQEAWRRFGFSHIDPADRQELMNDYRKREYANVKVSKAERSAEAERYDAAFDSKLPKGVLEGHNAANEATRLLAERQIKEAAERAEEGIGGATAKAAHTRTVMAMVRIAQGRHDQALRNLEQIGSNELRSRHSFELQMAEYTRRQRYGDALATIDEASRQFGTDEPFMPHRLKILLAQDDIDAAWAEHERCKEQAESKSIRSACDEVMKRAPRPDGEQPASPVGEGILDRLQGLVPSI